MPLYEKVHAYVRYRLHEFYGNDTVPLNGNIPIHLLGNMWGQQWNEIFDLVAPYPNVTDFANVTQAMNDLGYTPLKIFELGNDFFKSLGMKELPESFWNLSMLERPTDRDVVCHASAWDFFTVTNKSEAASNNSSADVRVKMCTEVDAHYLYVVHHELGHIQYYLQYSDQPTAFRGAPNPGFHEAVGDVIALSVGSPRHLHALGLSPVAELTAEQRINELFKTALKKIVFLPFAYTMDKYRYAVFRDEVDIDVWNCKFWQLRSRYSGVEPALVRTDIDFDPPAKYHIDADVEYLRYFAAHIFQFQFHKALCTLAGQYDANDPQKQLDNCDIYNSTEAGAAFG